MKTLLLVTALAIFAGAVSADDFDINAWCASRDYTRQFHQYHSDPADPQYFWQCEKTRVGIVSYRQSCKSCEAFSDTTWTCLPVSGCSTEAPITEIITNDQVWCFILGNGPAGTYLQKFRNGPNDVTYYWDVDGTIFEMPCAPGTYFNFDQCRCIACYVGGPCALGSNRIFTFDFDGRGSENGIYYDPDQSGLIVNDGLAGHSLPNAFLLDGVSTNIEVPYFQNNEFSQFTLIAAFNRNSTGGDDPQGIFYNGNDPLAPGFSPASIWIVSQSQSEVVAGIRTDSGTYQLSVSGISADVWNTAYLRYDGVQLTLQVNYNQVSTPASGTTIAIQVAALFGQSYSNLGAKEFFNGKLDDLSFYRSAIDLPTVAP